MPLPERGSEADARAAIGVLMVHTELASLSRGAELADMPVHEFTDVYRSYDARPWAAPEELEE